MRISWIVYKLFILFISVSVVFLVFFNYINAVRPYIGNDYIDEIEDKYTGINEPKSIYSSKNIKPKLPRELACRGPYEPINDEHDLNNVYKYLLAYGYFETKTISIRFIKIYSHNYYFNKENSPNNYIFDKLYYRLCNTEDYDVFICEMEKIIY